MHEALLNQIYIVPEINLCSYLSVTELNHFLSFVASGFGPSFVPSNQPGLYPAQRGIWGKLSESWVCVRL